MHPLTTPRPAGVLCRALAAAALVAGSISCSRAQDNAAKPAVSSFRDSLTIDRAPLDRTKAMPISMSPVLKKVDPAVVTIKTGVATVQPRAMTRDEAMFRYFFGRPELPELEERDRRGGKIIWQQIGLGTGVLVTKDGYILTNRHVVMPPDSPWTVEELIPALRLKVDVPGRTELLDATLIDYSLETDIAVIKVRGKDLPFATLADSDLVEKGDFVMAAGAPFGIQASATKGIISARRHDEVLQGMEKQELLQTDAPINPGNSGGPLIDMEGRVIGINTAIYTRTGGSMGIGFAIPINKAISAADALSRPRGWLGVELEALRSQRVASFFRIKGGAMINWVDASGPAAKAGLAIEDIVFSFNSKPVSDDSELRRFIASEKPGTEVTLGVVRTSTSQKTEVTVKLGERTNLFSEPADGTAGEESEPPTDRVAGMMLSPVTPEVVTRLSLPEGVAGVVVDDVLDDSPAKQSGIERNDVILKINGEVPSGKDGVVSLLKAHSGTQVRVQVRRGGNVMLRLMNAP